MHFLSSKITTGVLVCLLIVSGFACIKKLPALQDSIHRIQNITQQLNEANTMRAEIAHKKAYLQSASYRELQARLKLNYKKPNEHVVFIYDKNDASPTPGLPIQLPIRSADPTLPAIARPKSHWRVWLDYLLGE